MSATQRAWQRLLTADTVKAVLPVDGASGSLVTVSSGDVAKLYVEAYVLFASLTAPSAAANLRVVQVAAVDADALTVTLDPALPAAPRAGDELRLGLTHWLRGGNVVKYKRPAYSSPVQDLLDRAAAHEVVVLYGERPRAKVFAHAWDSTWELRAVSKSPRHAEGACERMRWLCDGKANSLAAVASGVVMSGLQAGQVEERERSDQFFESMVTARLTVARKVA